MAAYEKYFQLYGKPDIIHSHNALYAGMLGKKIREKFGVPYIVTEHSTVFSRQLISDKSTLKRVEKAYQNSASLTAVSQPFCDLLNNTFSTRRFEYLPNVLDPEFESKEFNTERKRCKEFVFVNIAELQPKKDHQTLIKAFKKVYLQHPYARLLIGGDGLSAEGLKHFVAKENLQDAVQFLGFLNREQVFAALQQSDCFVLSSKHETFGVVVIEAMLVGKPVIVTRCGGPESFVTKATGIVIEKENETELENAMVEMLRNSSSYNAGSIRRYAISHFGRERFTERVTKIYHECAGQTATTIPLKANSLPLLETSAKPL